MALVIADLNCAAQGKNAIFTYHSTDDVSAANYFDGAAHLLKVGDHIIQHDETNARHYTVDTNSGTAVTVVALSTA